MYVQITFPQRRSVMGKILLDPRITGAKINKNISEFSAILFLICQSLL